MKLGKHSNHPDVIKYFNIFCKVVLKLEWIIKESMDISIYIYLDMQ